MSHNYLSKIPEAATTQLKLHEVPMHLERFAWMIKKATAAQKTISREFKMKKAL